MIRRILFITLACAFLAFGGYQISFLRAGLTPPFQEVLAAAGSEVGITSAAGESEGRGYRISSLTVFSNVALHVNDSYVEPDRVDPREMLQAALEQIEREVAEVLVEEVSPGQLRVRVFDKEKMVFIDDVESLWEINLKLREVFNFFERELPPQEDLRNIEYAAINGALSTLDPHSVLLRPEAFAEMKTSTKGEFGGLGIVISIRDGKLTVISPLAETPAARAGLEAGDVISRIGDVSTVSMAIEEAVQMLRGPEGSKVTIWVEREGWPEARRYVVVRERIKIESVEGRLLSDNVGYIQIKNFQQNTSSDLEDALQRLKKEANGSLTGVVLDLRNNPGGLLEQAIQVTDRFVNSGDIVTTVGYGNQLREPKRARWAGTESDLPVAVLVNQGSASASEIVAGALKNLDRAVVVGERTFGKGSVQVLYDFADKSALKLTIAQYLTPGDISIQSEGVVPDIALRPAWVDGSNIRLFHRPEGHRESNLDKHLDRSGSSVAPYETKPKFTLTHLVSDDDDDDRQIGEFREDYNITFARRLLVAAGAPRTSSIMNRARSFLEETKKQARQDINEKLEALGLDWSEGKGAAVPMAINLELLGTDDALQEAKAGETVSLRATVENQGTEPVHRLRGVLDTEHPSFKGRELLFGRLGPAEKRSWTVEAKIPKDAVSRSDVVSLRLSTDAGAVPSASVLGVITRSVPHPQFAYAYVLDDVERGDGDGRLEVGEGIDLRVMVTYTGEGPAEDVSRHLMSAAGDRRFLERGRARIDGLAPGQTRVATLRFRIPVDKDSASVPLPLELTIYDGATGSWLEDQFELDASTDVPVKVSEADGPARAKSDQYVLDRPDPDGRVLASMPKGMVLPARSRVGDYYRVQLEEEATGFVSVDAVTVRPKGKRAAKKAPTASLAYYPWRRPLDIDLNAGLGGSVVDVDHIKLDGHVRGRGFKDLYVLVNEQKVFYGGRPKDLQPADASVDSKLPNDEAVDVPFSVELDLEEGLNRITVVARLDEHVVSYRSFFVSREEDRPAVAERKTPEETKRPE